jgi:hypothetical protein
MEKTLLWEAFAVLSKPELRDLDKFVHSPFFNRRDHLCRLFGYLQQCLLSGAKPEPAAAYVACFPGTPYSDSKMRLANSDLLVLLEQYWMQREAMAEPGRNRIRLAGVYRRHGLVKHLQITLREARKGLDSLPWRHAEYFDATHDLELEVFQAASAARRYEAFNLQEVSDLLDTTYIARKLRHICLSLSHQAVFNATYRFGMREAIEAYVESENLLTVPAVALYFHAGRFLADPAATVDFWRFREMLTASADQFPQEELRTLYLLAINFCIKKINESEHAWLQATYELYREALDRGLLVENGVLSRFAYNNIVSVAVRLGAVDWAGTFIVEYKPFLEKQYREASYSLNLARVAYVRKDYGTALMQLQRADYKDFINSANARILQMKIYYETAETDLLESHLDSMQSYIRRQDSAGYHRENYRNIVQFTRSLLRCNPNDPKEMTLLRRQVETEPVLTERAWLLDMLDFYEKRN